jgi:DNA-binding SARP family transcriptional activator
MHDTMSDVVTIDEPMTHASIETTPPPSVSAPAIPAQPGAGTSGHPRPDPWRLHVLGPVELTYDGRVVEVTGIARTLLALLARSPGEEVPTADMVVSIWGSDVPEDAENTVASHISRLRKALTAVAPEVNPTAVVLTLPTGYILSIGAASVDSEIFERLLSDGRRALAVGQPSLALARLDSALALWRGTAYEDFGDQAFTWQEAGRLAELRLAAIESRVDAELALAAPSAPQRLLAELTGLVAVHSHRERLWAQLMTVLYRIGRRGEALIVYRQAEACIAQGLTGAPGTVLRTVERALLANDPSLCGAPMPRFSVPAPLAATVPTCAGREEEIAWLLAGLDLAATRRGQGRLVVGSPGIGKTRLLAEVAQRAAERGVVVRYARVELAAGAGPGILSALQLTPDLLNLVVIDDLDLATHDDLRRVVDFVRAHRDDPLLTLISCRDQVRVGALGGLPKVVLTALGDLAIAEIVRVYAPSTTTAVAVAAMVNAGGVPAGVQRLASEWALARASRRIDRAAASAAEPRRALAKVRQDVVEGVLELEHVRARARPLRSLARELDSCPYRGLAPYEATDAEFFHGRRRCVAELVARLVDVPLLALVGPRGSGKSSVLRAGLMPALGGGILPDSERWRRLVVTPTSVGSLARCLAEDAGPPEPAVAGEETAKEEFAPAHGMPAELESGQTRVDDETHRPGTEAFATAASAIEASATGTAIEASATGTVVERTAPPHTVVLLDQFEEAYTLLGEDAKWELLDDVVEAARSGSVTVILGLRSEFYSTLAAHPDLSALVTANTVLLSPMTDEELWEAVVEPAALGGVGVEQQLAETLVAVAPEAGLAALSLTMQRLWQNRHGELLTLASYHSGPGMPAIIAATGEAVIASLGSDSARQAAARILACLAARTSEEVLVARPAPVVELLAVGGLGGPEALATLTEHELVTVTGTMAEVAHEELLVGWPRLRAWLDEESAQRALRTHLSRAATVWAESGGRADDLYGGARLAAALEFAAAHADELAMVEREFLAASHRVVTAAETRQRREITKLWRWLISMALVLAAAIAAGVLVFIAWQDATSASVRADAARVSAAARAEPELRLALLLAVAAYRLDDDAPTALRATLARVPNLLARAGEAVTAVAISPGGDSIASGTADGAIWLLRPGTLDAPVRLVQGSHAPVNGLTFTPDGRRLVSWAGSDASPAQASVVVWDVASRRPDGPAFGQAWPDSGGGLLADGATLVLTQHEPGSDAPAVVAWSLDSRTPSTAYDLPTGARGPVLVSADGSRIAVATGTGAIVADLATGHETALPEVQVPSALSPDGSKLLAVQGHQVMVWLVDERRLAGVVSSHQVEVTATAWSLDGTSFASADAGGSIVVWRTQDRSAMRTYGGVGGEVAGLRFGEDGQALYSASPGGLYAWGLGETQGVGSLADGAADAALPTLACALAGRDLTAEEWRRYLPGYPYRHVC